MPFNSDSKALDTILCLEAIEFCGVYLQPLAYMALHVTLTGMTFAVCKIWWNSYMAHSVFLLAILCISAWNGASYYFEVFAHRYVQTVGVSTKPVKKKQ